MQIMQAIDAVRGPAYGTVPFVPPPTIIDLILAGRTELWLHDGQKNGEVSGRVVWRYLMENREILAGCVRFSELSLIQSQGLDFFRQHFGKFVMGASLQDYFPCLLERDGDVFLGSRWVEYPMNADSPILRVL